MRYLKNLAGLAAAFLMATALALAQGANCGQAVGCSGNVSNAGDAVQLGLPSGTASGLITVTGTWTGTLSFNQSNGGPFVNATCYAQPSSGTSVSQTTSNGQWRCVLSAATSFQVALSGSPSGSASVNITTSTGSAASSGGGGGISTPVSVPNGGTGASTLTGLVKGNGASAMTAVSSIRSITFQAGSPGGSALSTGVLGYLTVPFACTIGGYSIQADAGTDTVKTLKVASGTAIPTLGSNSISTSGVSLATGTVIQSTTVTDFTTTTVTANDIMAADLITTSGTGYISFQISCAQ